MLSHVGAWVPASQIPVNVGNLVLDASFIVTEQLALTPNAEILHSKLQKQILLCYLNNLEHISLFLNLMVLYHWCPNITFDYMKRKK